jgi:hypothetical protein
MIKFFKGRKKNLLLTILNNRRHSWIGHIFRYYEFVGNILEGAISEIRPLEDLDYNT